MATSADRNGVAWGFDGDYLVGSFVDGSKYVVAPSGLTITSITPGWDALGGGSMLNPGIINEQGLDSRMYGYNAGVNVGVSLPLAVPSGSSLVTSKSLGSYDGSDRTWMERVEVLTVLPSDPPANSFRPPYAGTDKTIRGSLGDIDWSWVQNLDHPNTVSSPNSGIGEVQIELYTQWRNSEFKTQATEAPYGANSAYQMGIALTWLHLNNTQTAKRQTMINLVQRGIDVFGSVKAAGSGGWWPNGGHNSGKKLPLIVASKALGDSEILGYCTSLKDGYRRFQEDEQHFYVQQSQVGVDTGEADRDSYEQQHVGMADWTSNARSELDKATPEWSAWSGSTYRFVNGKGNVGQALGIELSGLRASWDDEALFEYIEDRYYPSELLGDNDQNHRVPTFIQEMYSLYKGNMGTVLEAAADPVFSVPYGGYSSEQSVAISSTNADSIYYTVNGDDPTASSTLYVAPISVSESQTIKAIAVKAGASDSQVVSSRYLIGSHVSSSGSFTNISFSNQTGGFSYEFDAIAASTGVDAVLGLSDGANNLTPGVDANAFTAFASMVRFYTNNKIEARDGSSYVELLPSYEGGVSYHFKLIVDLSAKTYVVTVAPSGGAVTVSGTLDFRTEQSAISQINNLSITHIDNQSLLGGAEVILSNARLTNLKARPSIARPALTKLFI